MNLNIYELLTGELKTQIQFALISYNEFEKIRKQMMQKYEWSKSKFWYYLQNFVINTADITRLLQALDKIDDHHIKTILNEASFPTLLNFDKSKNIRNSLVHIDERLCCISKNPASTNLDKGLKFMASKYIIEHEKGSIIQHANKSLKTQRVFINDKQDFLIYGQRFNIPGEISDIKKLNRML